LKATATYGGGVTPQLESFQKQWKSDVLAITLARGITGPADTTVPMAQTLVRSVIEALAPSSAGAALLALGLQVDFGRTWSILLPGFSAGAQNATFVQQGQPHPVRRLSVDTPPIMNLYKILSQVVFTREMLMSSAIDELARDALTRSIALALDSALFDANPAVPDVRPAGLLNGITALTASTDTDRLAAMLADLETLARSIAQIAGLHQMVLIMDPGRGAVAPMRVPGDFPFKVLASAALTANEIIAIAPVALANGFGSTPEIETAKETTLHMEDTNPAPIVGGASPLADTTTVAAPTRSLWQSDAVALKLRLPVSWALRSPQAVAWLQAANW
jgi:hypothetical protein